VGVLFELPASSYQSLEVNSLLLLKKVLKKKKSLLDLCAKEQLSYWFSSKVFRNNVLRFLLLFVLL